ncbi:MAG: hypothetical protein J6T39_01830 [Clostridia bacterium]|nr:hypothetical protein [Clostridia bacterium]
MAVFSWVSGKELQALTKCRDEGRIILVEVCNEYGETGWVKGKIATNPKMRILNDFTLLVNYGKHGVKRVGIKLDRADVKVGSDFLALTVVDAKTKTVIYDNPNREIVTHPELYDGNAINHLDKIEKVKSKKDGEKLLAGIGQFVSVVDNENDFHSVKGVLKSVYVVGEDQVLLAKIALGHDAMAFRRLNGTESISLTRGTANNIVEETDIETF